MKDWDHRCRSCGTGMEEVERHEGGNYRDEVTYWCPECGTLCGPFTEAWGPGDNNWRFPEMTAMPEAKTALTLMKDTRKIG